MSLQPPRWDVLQKSFHLRLGNFSLTDKSELREKIILNSNNWELIKIANGHLSCENPKLDASSIDEIERNIQNKFGSIIKEEHIIVSYDNWSGVYIMQIGTNTHSDDILIKKIYDYLREI